jgi:hypothetical protein
LTQFCHYRQSGGAHGQTQEPSARKFHLALPLASHHSIISSARASSVGATVRELSSLSLIINALGRAL